MQCIKHLNLINPTLPFPEQVEPVANRVDGENTSPEHAAFYNRIDSHTIIPAYWLDKNSTSYVQQVAGDVKFP